MSRVGLAGFILLAAVAVACGSESNAAPTAAPTPLGTPITKEDAIKYATESDIDSIGYSRDFGANSFEVTAEHLTASEASRIMSEMGIGEFLVGEGPVDTCPAMSFGCGAGDVYAGEMGWLVLTTGVPQIGVVPTISGGRVVRPTWIGDNGPLIGFRPAYPAPPAVGEGPQSIVARTDWELRTAPSSDLLDLRVAVGSSSCDTFDRIAISESADTVTLHAYVRTQFEWGGSCTDDFVIRDDVIVQLQAPLGDRELIGCDGHVPTTEVFANTQGGVDCRRLGTP
jgi:hypothetical protein